MNAHTPAASQIEPQFKVIALGGENVRRAMNRLAYGHLVEGAEAGLRQSWAYYRDAQRPAIREMVAKGWPGSSPEDWRPHVRADVAKVRAARAKAGV